MLTSVYTIRNSSNRKLKTLNSIFAGAVILISSFPLHGQPTPSLDDILGVGKSDLAESKPETLQLWNNLLSALEQNNIADAKSLSLKFTNVVDFTEPYQMNLAATALEVLNTNYDTSASSDANFDEGTKAAIAEVQSQIAPAERKIKALSDKKPELQKKVGSANTTAAVLGALLGPQLGGISNADKQNIENELKQVDSDIAEQKVNIRALTQKLPELQAGGQKIIKEGRNKAFTLTKELIEGAYFREAIALANTCLKKYGQDMEFTRLSQSAVNQQKTQNKAVAIARAATADAAKLIAQNHIWEAKVELEKSFSSIKERVNDSDVLRFTQIEVGKITRDLARKVEVALKARGTIMKSAERDAVDGGKKFVDFLAKYPDYPEADEDRLRLSDLKTKQIEVKFAKRIAAIEEAISNDPAEAKAMIKRLIADNTDPDEVSVIKSRMTKLEKVILDQEIKQIRGRLDEAQSYLTKWNVTYAEEVKKGGKPQASFTASLGGGVENLTRAISVQEGVVKQIDVLLSEPMEKVSKSQVVALQETARGALEFMLGAREKAASGKVTTMIGGIVVMIVLLSGGYLFVRRKRTPSAVA